MATPEFLKNYRMMVKAKKAKLEVFYFTWRPQKKIEILIFLKRYIFSYINQLTHKPCITCRNDNPDSSTSLEEQAPDMRAPAVSDS